MRQNIFQLLKANLLSENIVSQAQLACIFSNSAIITVEQSAKYFNNRSTRAILITSLLCLYCYFLTYLTRNLSVSIADFLNR